ncbi:MAG TPA: C cytochrome, partial [Candidatus Paenibacillus intestinavium]|nr:C cytochrome [Candidatus Paenibacillus intestinavium]
MRKTSTLVLGFLFVVSLAVIGLMANQLGKNEEAAPNTETAEQKEEVTGVTHTPPSLDDVPEGPLGEAILRGYELTNDTSNVLRGEAATTADGELLV